MSISQVVFLLANFLTASTLAAAFWLHFDALLIRFEIKAFFRGLGFALLAIVFGLYFAFFFLAIKEPPITFFLQSLALWLLFVSFILDSHSKLKLITILAIVAFFFFKSHALLAIQTFLITLVVFEIAYYTKHRDLIPLAASFLLISIGEFFYDLDRLESFAKMVVAGNFLYIFASIALFIWLWQYLIVGYLGEIKPQFRQTPKS